MSHSVTPPQLLVVSEKRRGPQRLLASPPRDTPQLISFHQSVHPRPTCGGPVPTHMAEAAESALSPCGDGRLSQSQQARPSEEQSMYRPTWKRPFQLPRSLQAP